MFVRSLGIVLLAGLALPLPALASAWDPSFPPPAVGSYLPAEAGTIVVGAGAPSTDLSEAEVALAAALKASGKAKLVMDDVALGDLSALDDAAIVARAKALPVARIAVLRVFTGAEGAEPSAVVTFYDQEGNATGAFSVERGAILAAAEIPAAAPGQGASTAAMRAVAQVGKTVSATASEAQKRYDREYVWFESWAGVGGKAWMTPYRGKGRKSIDGSEFYEIVGRPDLASDYRTGRAWRTGFKVGSGVLLAGGLVFAGMSLFHWVSCDEGACDDAKNELIIGGGLLGGSLAMNLVGSAIHPHPITSDEARRMADEYNDQLKKELGLSAALQAPADGIRAGLAALPGGGAAMTLSGSLP